MTPTSPTEGPDSSTASVEAAWIEHRQRVLDIGYRMLSTVTDAEDVAQEVFARLAATDIAKLDDVLGWLVTVTSRLCVDRLRLHENSRRAYVGPWLPEPVVDISDDIVGEHVTLDDSIRMALLVVLDRLKPAERVAFVLHDVFALPYNEIGEIVGRSPQACRQLATRARRSIQSDPTTAEPPTDHDRHQEIAERFAAACRVGDLKGLIEVLAPDAMGDFDSGGMMPNAPLTELDGAETIAKVIINNIAAHGPEFTVRDINGYPGVLITHGGHVVGAIALGVHDGQVDLVLAIGNPNKLAHLQPVGPSELPAHD